MARLFSATLALLLLSRPVAAQAPSPRFLYIYRDSLKAGVDSAYRAIENDGAQICADLKCPNPYFAIESLSGSHEVWWINAFDSEADTTRVAQAYTSDSSLSLALAAIATRKKAMIGRPIGGFAVYQPALSRGPSWSVVNARFVVVVVTRSHRPVAGSVWGMADSTLYVFQPARTQEEAEGLAHQPGARIFAVRPNWSMPAAEWVAADQEFWRAAPSPRRSSGKE